MTSFICEIRLRLLKNFMDHVYADAVVELDSIEKKCESGEYQQLGDYQTAVDYPMERVAIASRAVCYELVALVEQDLHELAHAPWLRSVDYKGPKNVQELRHVNPQTLSQLKMVSDLPFDRIIELVESHYKFRLDDVEGWDYVGRLRDDVNALKHRAGMKHYREINWWDKDCVLPQRHEVDQGQAYEAMEKVGRFLRSLSQTIRQCAR